MCMDNKLQGKAGQAINCDCWLWKWNWNCRVLKYFNVQHKSLWHWNHVPFLGDLNFYCLNDKLTHLKTCSMLVVYFQGPSYNILLVGFEHLSYVYFGVNAFIFRVVFTVKGRAFVSEAIHFDCLLRIWMRTLLKSGRVFRRCCI